MSLALESTESILLSDEAGNTSYTQVSAKDYARQPFALGSYGTDENGASHTAHTQVLAKEHVSPPARIGTYGTDKNGTPEFVGRIGTKGDVFVLRELPAQVAAYVFDPLYVNGGKISETGLALVLQTTAQDIRGAMKSIIPTARLVDLRITPEKLSPDQSPHVRGGQVYRIEPANTLKAARTPNRVNR